MSESHPIKELLHSIGLGVSAEHAAQPVNAGKESGTQDLADFTFRLNQVLRQHPDVGGHLFLLDFSQVKAKLKNKWQGDVAKMHERIYQTINGHLAPHDLTIRKDETNYLVLFPSLNFEEGEIKASVIAEELDGALLGTKGQEHYIEVKSVTVSSGGGVSTRDVPPVAKVLERVTARLGSVPKPSEQQVAQVVRRRAPSRPLPEDGKLLATPRERLKYGTDYHFVFRPLLSAKTKVISTFLCIPVRETEPGHFISGYEILPADRTIDEIFELDMTKAERVATEVKMLEKAKMRSLLALPIHFEILADHTKRSAFIEFCQEQFKGLTKRIIIEITNLPAGIPQQRLLEFVTALKPISRTIITRFSVEQQDFSACRGLGVHAVGMDVYNSADSEAELMRKMSVFSQRAHKAQLKTYIEGVRSLSLFTAAMTSGYDYIAGYAISGVVESTEEIRAFQLDSLYMSMLQDMGRLPKL